MHMIGIYKIDLHVNAVFLGVLGEVAGYAGRSGFCSAVSRDSVFPRSGEPSSESKNAPTCGSDRKPIPHFLFR
jgi:hypothetical protein